MMCIHNSMRGARAKLVPVAQSKKLRNHLRVTLLEVNELVTSGIWISLLPPNLSYLLHNNYAEN